MSFLGILKNVAKVGVGLLNGVLNGDSSLATFEERCAATPDLTYTDSTTKTQYRILSKYILVHNQVSRLGAAPASVVEDGEVTIALAEDSQGQTRVHAINHTKSPYLIAFNGTDPSGTVGIQNSIVMGTDSSQGNVTDITDNFNMYPSGNMISTRVENNDQEPTPGTLMLPPLSSVLANVGITNLISTIITTLFGYKNATLSLIWRTDASNRIIGFTLKNDTTLTLNITATLSWSNPRNASTYNASVAARGEQDVDIEVAESPVSSASVAVFSSENLSSAVKHQIYENIAMQAATTGAVRLNARVGHKHASNGSHSSFPTLSSEEKQLLLRIVPSLEGSDATDFSTKVQAVIKKVGGVQKAIAYVAQVNKSKNGGRAL